MDIEKLPQAVELESRRRTLINLRDFIRRGRFAGETSGDLRANHEAVQAGALAMAACLTRQLETVEEQIKAL